MNWANGLNSYPAQWPKALSKLGWMASSARTMGCLAGLLVLLMLTLAFASTRATDRIDAIVRDEMDRSRIPGVAVLVVKDGRILKEAGFGFADLDHNVPVTPKTLFESGSVGKEFTATLVMLLAERHVLGLDDSIVNYLPEGKGKWDGVTIRDLLDHTSGIGDMPYDTMDLRKDYSEAQLADIMARQPICASPGATWRYNNGGYVLLGILIHRATGRFYGDLLASEIFKPLGMKTAGVINEEDVVPNRAMGYEFDRG